MNLRHPFTATFRESKNPINVNFLFVFFISYLSVIIYFANDIEGWAVIFFVFINVSIAPGICL